MIEINNKELMKVLDTMSAKKFPSPDCDVLFKERSDKNWSGTEYNATAIDLEHFVDNIGDRGISSVGNLGESATFGNGYVSISFFHQDIENTEEIIFRKRAYKLEFECDVSFVLCIFEEFLNDEYFDEDSPEDPEDIKWNFYNIKSGSRDPSDESHGYWQEIYEDVMEVEIYD